MMVPAWRLGVGRPTVAPVHRVVRVALTPLRCQGSLDSVVRTYRYSDIGEYIQFMRRIIRAAGQRVSEADPEQLRDLVGIRQDLDEAIACAVEGLRESGATWEDIGRITGTSRQAAHEKWSKRIA